VKNVFKKLAKFVLLPLLVLVVGSLLTASYLINAGKAVNENSNWYASDNGIDEEAFVTLGGFDQYIRIRGRDRNNPVMLDLHGGPGGAQSGATHRTFRPLAEYFTLVEWDQRGAGKSAGDDSLVPTMNYQRMVDDTVALIEHLKQRLGVDKVILVGHSWGAMLGIGVVQKRPDLIAAYVGVGQALAWNKSFDESQRLLMDAAKKSGDTEVYESLVSLPKSWPPKQDTEAFIERITIIQGLLGQYGKGIHALKETNLFKSELIMDAILSPDISLTDILGLLSGMSAPTMALIEDLYERDFRSELGYQYQVPMIIFQGEHDWQTPTSLVKPWFAKLEAPYKKYVAFEDSAHIVISEEAGKYLYEMVSKVRPFALQN
jgi:pimeloyl-ACP methyl ester carboxylesterase